MAFELTPVGVLFAMAALAATAIAGYVAVRLDRPGARGLLLLLVGDAVWATTDAVNWATTDFGISSAMLSARYLGIVCVPVALFAFTVAYTGRSEWLTRRNVVALSIPSVVTVLAVATNPLHELFYEHVASAPGTGKGIDWSYGVAAVPWIVWAYVLVLASVYLLARYAMVSDRVYRWQAVALIVMVLVPTVTDLLFFTVPALTVNVTPLGVLAGGFVFGAAVHRHDLLDLVPATRELGRDELIERMDMGTVLVDADGDVADVNAAAARILGVDPTAALGERARDAVPDLLPVLADREEVDLTLAVDGDERRFDVRAEPVGAGGGRATLVTLRDVTDRHERRRELERYETVMETLADPVMVTDAEGTVVYANPASEAVTGYDATAIEGMDITAFATADGADRVEGALATLADGDRSRATLEIDMETADGRRFPVEARLSPLPGGDTFRGVAGVVRDVGRRERRKRQLTVLNRVLRHNLRSRMQVVLGNATYVAEAVEDPALVEPLDAIGEAARELTELSDEARTLQNRAADTETRFHNLASVVADRLDDHRAAYPDATFDVDVPHGTTVQAGAGLVEVVDNLVDNAVVHHDGDDPTVTIDAVPDDERPDEWVRFRVADDGPGIPPVERRVVSGDEEITELQHGSGIGLWMVAWIVRSNGGEVDIRDRDPRGTVVSCRLKLA